MFYFDETTKAGFEQYFPEGCVVAGPENDLYAVNYTAQVRYYWSNGDNQYQGVYSSLTDPFTKGWLSDGEFIDLMKDITLSGDIVCQLTSGSFTMNFGEFNIYGDYHIILKEQVSVITDKQVEVFSVSAEDAAQGCFIKETEMDGGHYKYEVYDTITVGGEPASGFEP